MRQQKGCQKVVRTAHGVRTTGTRRCRSTLRVGVPCISIIRIIPRHTFQQAGRSLNRSLSRSERTTMAAALQSSPHAPREVGLRISHLQLYRGGKRQRPKCFWQAALLPGAFLGDGEHRQLGLHPMAVGQPNTYSTPRKARYYEHRSNTVGGADSVSRGRITHVAP